MTEREVLKRSSRVRQEAQDLARRWTQEGHGLVVMVRGLERYLIAAGYTESTSAEVARIIVQGVRV